MKTILVKPYNLSDHIQPSLGLGYLAGAVRSAGHDVGIVDCIKEGLKLEGLLERVKNEKADAVGLQCYTFDLKFVKEALAALKKAKPDLVTLAGGVHPSAMPEETFKYFENFLDYIFVGEAEKGLPMLLDDLSGKQSIGLNNIPGLAWREEGQIRRNKQIFTEDLDSLGMPAWDLIKPEAYPEAQHGAFFKKFPIAPIMATRGCPYGCTFCAGDIVSGRKIRKHSPKFMLNQINYLYKVHGIREFHMIDDNFTFDKAYVKEFLNGLAELNLDMSWATPNGVRVDSLDEEMLRLMKKTGLYLVSLGIESGSDRILQLMKKRTTARDIRKGINLIRSSKIDIAGFFIMGFPGETRSDIDKTIRFSLELPLIRANYFTYLPFPGSPSYNELRQRGELENVDWERFYFMSAPYVPRGMDRDELKRFHKKAFMRFYLRPRILIKNILSIKSVRHFKFLLKRFFHWILMR